MPDNFYSMTEDKRRQFEGLGPDLDMKFSPPQGVTPQMLQAAKQAFEEVWNPLPGDDGGSFHINDGNWGDVFGYVWAAMDAAKRAEAAKTA